MASRKSRTSSSARTKSGGARRKSGTTSRKTTSARKTSVSKRSTAKRSAVKRGTAKRSTAKRSTAKSRTAGRKTGATRKASTASRAKTGTARRKTSTARRKTGASAPRLSGLQDVLVQQLGDLYSSERQLVAALPKLARAASNDELEQAFQHHLEETRAHVERLDRVFRGIGGRAPRTESAAMRGLVQEGERVVAARGDASAKDAALIAAAQRVEHYEIAGYGTARTLADQLGHDQARDLLQETLDEESNANELLTKIATGGMFRSGVNEEAA
jgi:ferritin-like metal-binding protein YciE